MIHILSSNSSKTTLPLSYLEDCLMRVTKNMLILSGNAMLIYITFT